jgi:CxxC motif-containing protein (DUF1111 family)
VANGLLVTGGCFSERHDFNPVNMQRLNSIALFGAGWIDKLSERAITHQRIRRSVAAIANELRGDFSDIPPGRPRILPDGRIGKFGWKAQFATLEEFVAAACANELGLGTPRLEQARPLGASPSTASPASRDLDQTQFESLVAYVATLPRPEAIVPGDPSDRDSADHGKTLFARVGCAACHTPDLGGIAGVYSDFLLHRTVENLKGYSETPDVPVPAEHPLPDEWKTPPLWGVADSAPYFHDGTSPTLDAAIRRHAGEARSAAEAYRQLSPSDRDDLLGFLATLKAPRQGKGAQW